MNHCKDQKFFMIFFQFAQFERQIFQKKKIQIQKQKRRGFFFRCSNILKMEKGVEIL